MQPGCGGEGETNNTMAELTQAQARTLSDILGKLRTSKRFIDRPNVKILVDHGSTGTSEINKELGSELNYLDRAIEKLELFLYGYE
jgi:hypothetical protein